MSKQPPRIPPAQPPLAAPCVDPAPGDPPDNLAAGLSVPVLAAAQAALPAVQRKRTATGKRGPRWTRARQVDFLVALAETHSVAEAARRVGMSRQSAYRRRQRLREQPFGRAWDAAYASARHSLYRAALERAIEGVEVPHFAGGELVGTSRKFDERLTLALLAMPTPAPAELPAVYPGSAYPSTDFRGLLERVETGPDHFEADESEHHLLRLEAEEDARWAADDAEDKDKDESGDWEY